MKVKELIELLKNEDPDSIVICQKDPEGNGYSPLYSVEGDSQGYVPDSTWSGERALLKLTPELVEQGFSEEDVDETAEKAVFLVPVN